MAAAAAFLAWRGGPAWQGDLAALTPVAPAALALDAELRGQLGAPEPGQIAVVRGGSAEQVLRREEALAPVLDRLVAEGAIGGVEMAARLLPSQATQRARQAALPDAATLAARIAEAGAGLGFAATAFQPFQAAVAAARAMPPVRPDDPDDRLLRAPLLKARLGALLLPRDGGWIGPVAPRGVRDPARLAAALRDQPVVFVDVGRETSALAGGYARAAWPLLLGGGLASLACLLVALRDLRRVARVLGAVAAALLVTRRGADLAGVRLSLIHLVSLQFVAGVGLDYALFFARPQLDEEERARTLRTLVTCNAHDAADLRPAVAVPDAAAARHRRHGRAGAWPAPWGSRSCSPGRDRSGMTPLVLTADQPGQRAGRVVRTPPSRRCAPAATGCGPSTSPAWLGGLIGRVEGVEAHALPPELAAFDCRNNRLADMALRTDGFAERGGRGAWRGTGAAGSPWCSAPAPAASCPARRPIGGATRRPARCRTGFDYRRTHDLYSLARFVARRPGLHGPALTVSPPPAPAAPAPSWTPRT